MRISSTSSPSLVDVINVIRLEGILEQGKRVIIESQLQVCASVGSRVLVICIVVVVGAGKLIRVYVLYGVHTRPFTNRYSLITSNLYYLGSR